MATLFFAIPQLINAKVFLTQEQAMNLAFPDCAMARKTVFLTDAQVETIKSLVNQTDVPQLVYPYEATCDGEKKGTVYFDTHRVRTLPESLMIAIDPQGVVLRVEIVQFNEPQEYIPSQPWYDQLLGKQLTETLELKRDIQIMTGATLTSRATTDAVRRVLAIHKALQETIHAQ